MGLYVILTKVFRQIGSSESKSLEEKEEVDRVPAPSKNAPWPVNKGGLWLKVYNHSLSIAFLILFLLAFCLHAYGSLKDYNLEQALKGEPTENIWQFLAGSKLWFESFQKLAKRISFSIINRNIIHFSERKRFS